MEVFAPLTLSELKTVLTKLVPGAVIAGGCTDLSVRFLKEPKPKQLLNISGIDELRKIFVDGSNLNIGAAVTFTELENYALPEEFAALRQAASDVGSKQIRNAATVGGNVMNASPAGDLIPVLFMLDAAATFIKPDGSVHECPISELVIGAGRNSLAYNEVLTAVKIPLHSGMYSAFWKLGFRKKVTIARINIAMSVAPADVKFYLGAVAELPLRVREAEKIIAENEWNPETCNKLAEFLSGLLKQTVPAEFDRDYKALAVKGAVYDILSGIEEQLTR